MTLDPQFPIDVQSRRPDSSQGPASLEAVQAEWDRQNEALQGCWKTLESAGNIQIGVPESFLRELEDICRFRPTIQRAELEGIRC